MNLTSFFAASARWGGRIPEPVLTGVGEVVGAVLAAVPSAGREQLRKNLTRVVGKPVGYGQLRRSYASYMRMFAQLFALPHWSRAQIAQRGGCVGQEHLLAALENGPAVIALTHSGNWDLIGAWASSALAPVVTVAEKLEPPAVFAQFKALREHLGMEILGASAGEKLFERLLAQVRGRRVIVPLLADRDITGTGISVNWAGQRALVAAGPAALAVRLGVPVFAGFTRWRRVRVQPGNQRRWGVEVIVSDPLYPDEAAPNPVEELTARWAAHAEKLLSAHPDDWHMLQPVWEADLDPARLARSRARAQTAHRRDT